MFTASTAWWELVLRALATYVFMIVLLRATGKRQVGQLTPFDLILLMLLSNAVQSCINGGDNSLVGGFISATALVAANHTLSYLTWRGKRVAAWVEGRPRVLVHNGRVFTDVMHKERLTQHELDAALRAAGVAGIEQVHFAILENNGRISVQAHAASAGPSI